MEQSLIRTSKFLSLILRHQPELIRLSLDEHGWADIGELLDAAKASGRHITRELLLRVVQENDKKRFAISEDGTKIRASQGHSIEVDLQYAPQVPPERLYHGTATRFLDSIREKGLLKMERHHVHLSGETAVTAPVGARHGNPALLIIRAGDMHRAGHVFYRSANGVWLVEHVPPQFIDFPTANPPGKA